MSALIFREFMAFYRLQLFLSPKTWTFGAIYYRDVDAFVVHQMRLVEFCLYFCRQKHGLLEQFEASSIRLIQSTSGDMVFGLFIHGIGHL